MECRWSVLVHVVFTHVARRPAKFRSQSDRELYAGAIVTVPTPRQAVPGVWRRSWFDAFTDWVDEAPGRRVWVYHAAWLSCS